MNLDPVVLCQKTLRSKDFRVRSTFWSLAVVSLLAILCDQLGYLLFSVHPAQTLCIYVLLKYFNDKQYLWSCREFGCSNLSFSWFIFSCSTASIMRYCDQNILPLLMYLTNTKLFSTLIIVYRLLNTFFCKLLVNFPSRMLVAYWQILKQSSYLMIVDALITCFRLSTFLSAMPMLYARTG
jgi:hypothetical protein